MTARRPTVETLAPGVVCVTAPNPGPMTGPGTNSYVVGTGPCLIIDPGVDDAAHLDAIAAEVVGAVVAVVVTHGHPDHTGGARTLARRFHAPVLAHPTRLQGVRDDAFWADRPLVAGTCFELGDITLETLHTPGHAADHLCFFWREAGLLFAGDTVMADVTVVIFAPDGDMSAYLDSLAQLAALPVRRIAPGHGRLLDDAPQVLADIMAHRREREAQVRDALGDDAVSADTIAARLYPDLDVRLRGMAAAQVQSHLVRLAEFGGARADAAGWRAGATRSPPPAAD